MQGRSRAKCVSREIRWAIYTRREAARQAVVPCPITESTP
jgi:hypothetical protein